MSVQLDWTTSLPSTSSAAASPVKTSATPAREPASRASVPAFGANTLESFASFDPASLSWRTSQRSLLGDWETFSETWPRSGMMQSGIASAPATLGPRIEGSGSSLWPTPCAMNPNAQESLETWQARREELKAKNDYFGLSLLPRDASPTRLINRCRVTGRRRAFIRRFQMSRMTFRELASQGMIPGVTKSSW